MCYRMVTVRAVGPANDGLRSDPALAVVALGGLDGVAEDDRWGQEEAGHDQRGDHEAGHHAGEPEHEGEEEQGDGEGEEQVADPVGEERPAGDLSAPAPDGIVVGGAHRVGRMVRVAWDGDERGSGRTGVLVVTLDRPHRRNAVDHATLVALVEAQRQAAAARVVVLTGAPPAFSAGADLTGVEEGEFATALHRALRGFTELAVPVIAAVDGPALGAGTQLVISCDLRVATPASRFGIPAARLGLVVDHWTVERMTRELGWPIARGMLLAAEQYDATALHAAGAVHRLGDLDDALAWARQLAELAPLTMAAHKLALERSAPPPPADESFEAARLAAWASADAREGREAFLAKRPARFTGC
jgi:enoyl-CoA hydratase/carnithine racemase